MPTISLCMITKNEESFLEQSLNSVKDLVDEIIIVDTGSTDKTKEIAQKFTDKVYDFEWCDDFSKARNESLKYAIGDWILILDADETLSEKDHGNIIKATETSNSDVEGYILTQRNYFKSKEDLKYGSFGNLNVMATGQDKREFIDSKSDSHHESRGSVGWLETPIVRLFKNKKGIQFSGVIHEDVSPSIKGQIRQINIPIHHYGKMDINSWKQKWDFYEKLSEKKVSAKEDYYSYFELGRQYLENKRVNLAKEMFFKSSEINPDYYLNWFNLGTICLIENNPKEAIRFFRKAHRT